MTDISLDSKELVTDGPGKVHQAGADAHHQDYVKEFKDLCEESLFAFSKGVLNRNWFSTDLHLWCCNWLQRVPPHRKLLLLPRTHCKTAIVSHAMPIHILIQPQENNRYFPGMFGGDCRILLAGESESRVTDHLRVVQTEFEENNLLQSLWPDIMWDKPRRDAKKWNEKEMIVNRRTSFPDPSIRAVGVGGAITGARPNVIIEDDLISLDAANSDVVMQTAIEWHKASKALLDTYDKDSDLQSLSFVIGTHWAAYDLYTYIQEEDPTFECVKRSLYEIDPDGEIKLIWPERYDWEAVEELKRSHGARFWLMYMNQPLNSDITDFDMQFVRRFTLDQDRNVVFDTENRDKTLEKVANLGKDADKEDGLPSGQQFVAYNSASHDRLFSGRGGFFNSKYQRDGVQERD